MMPSSNGRPNWRDRRQRGPDNKGLQRAIQYLGRYRRQAILPYLFLIVATVSQLAVPRMVRNIIDAVSEGYIAGRQADAPNAVLTAGFAIVIFAILRGVFAFLQAYWSERNSQAVAFELRNDLFAKIQRLSFSYHDRNQTGQLMIRATDDVEKVRLFIGQGLVQLLGAAILIVSTLVILFTTNVPLALAALPILPVAFVLFMVFGMVSQPMFAKVQQKLSALNTLLQENLAGIKVIKAFTREASEQAKFKKAADSLMNQQITLARLFTFMFPLIFLIANLGQASTLYFGGRQIVEGTLTLGEWQEFSLYLIYLFLPIAQFGIIITQLGQAGASAGRIFEILDAKSDVTDKPNARLLPDVQGQVKFENVTFKYFHSGDPVLTNVTFEAKPGETVALLGATGSGKTTIINLLPRFYDPTEGRITIDGHDLRDVTLDSLRSSIGIVLQETTLFSGAVRDNIAFGRPEASDEEIVAAAKAAAAHDFITSFPQGYDTPVGERGATLSGGQKQRVAIARALLLDPHILILDDSTSSVDVATEAQIQRALDKLMKGRTSFVIAQRISTVINADQILVLDKGAIVARGKHEDLMEDSALYAEIYNSQLVADASEQSTETSEQLIASAA
jgi:ATP-binding cassette subfamily B protein